MAKIISQSTFDEVVMENISEFSMSVTEAKAESIRQFEAQGIDLSNIIRDLCINEESGQPVLNESIDAIKSHISGQSVLTKESLIENLEILKRECEMTLPHRVLAGKSGAHKIILALLEQELISATPRSEMFISYLSVMNSLLKNQPDLFDDEALSIALRIFAANKNEKVISYTLQWLLKACIMHETNRQNIVNADIITHLKPFINSKCDSQVVKDLCAVLRGLILDDDIRVEFGKAHEHARYIASEVLVDLTILIPSFDDPSVISDLILTIASLAVRQEFCATIEESGGLEYMFDALKRYENHERLIRESLKFLRAMAGNDVTKLNIVNKGAAPIIHNILNIYKNNEPIAHLALACISTLTLRVKENSAVFFETGISETIVDTMRLHPKSKIVQRNAAWAIRNMVSRSRNQCESFIVCGVEELLNLSFIEHPSITQDIKAALRDLGCKVELKEEWTGKAEKKILKD